MSLRTFFEPYAVYLKPASLRMFFFGFSSGLPLLLVLGTLGFWLREAGVDLKTIGFLSWVGLIYGFKWVWAPAVDAIRIPVLGRLLGRRRSWLLCAQLGLVVSLCALGFSDPAVNVGTVAVFALATAFCSATQDIALDAYRIESAKGDMQAALAATYQTGYRIAMIWAGAGALALAAFASSPEEYSSGGWHFAYLVMAASVSVGLITTLISPEPAAEVDRPAGRNLKERVVINVIAPFTDFFARYGRAALPVLALVATYRISDILMGVMANPFYADMGFTKEEVAAVTKVFGVLMTLLGAFVGGAVTIRLGVLRTLMIGAVLSAGTNLLFSVLATVGHSVPFLIFTVSADNLAGGLASAAFVAYLSGLTNKAYSASQYALFSSLMLLLPKFLAGFSGVMVEAMTYSGFFVFTACIGVPIVFLVLCAEKMTGNLN